MSMTRIPLSKCKLWWPAWQQGIPFTSYGYYGGRKVFGEGYEFTVDKDMDSWLVPPDETETRRLMPISGATLEDCDEGPINWTSFSILSDGRVQVNYQIPGENGCTVDFYPLDALSFVGDAYEDDE